MATEGATPRRWNEEETLLGLFLYFQLPFGKLHSGNPEIKQLAAAIGRTSSSVAMKLCNFASLDPKITDSGRKGLSGASRLDRDTYAKFAQNWGGLVERGEKMWAATVSGDAPNRPIERLQDVRSEFRFTPFSGESTTEAIVTRRRGQDFFRRAVIANYGEQCCITGIADPRLLVASHIVPWRTDEGNRHNPANGLLLSATFDKAFDCGLISVGHDQKIIVSKQLVQNGNPQTRDYFAKYVDVPIRPAVRFDPDPAFLDWHLHNCFVDNAEAAR